MRTSIPMGFHNHNKSIIYQFQCRKAAPSTTVITKNNTNNAMNQPCHSRNTDQNGSILGTAQDSLYVQHPTNSSFSSTNYYNHCNNLRRRWYGTYHPTITNRFAVTTEGNDKYKKETKKDVDENLKDTYNNKSAGIGLHNVVDRMIPSVERGMDKSTTLYKHTKTPKTATIIGAPMTYGQPYVGTDTTPELLRQGGLSSKLSTLGWRVEDLPDLDFDTAYIEYKQQLEQNTKINASNSTNSSNSNISKELMAKNSIQVGAGCQLLASCVYETLQKGNFPVILGGDHSIAIGSIAGLLRHRPDTGILWIDAHADLNTPDVSDSGNMHGMPVGINMICLDKYGSIPGLEWLLQQHQFDNNNDANNNHISSDYRPRLSPTSIVYIGLRDVDYAERKRIREMGIRAYTMKDIDHYGIGKVMDMALYDLLGDTNDANRPIHVSYDIDAVDPIYAPATGTAVRGGLTYRESLYIAEAVSECGNLASAEIVELNPSLLTGSDRQVGTENTIDLGLLLLTSLMGKSII